jgi:hypothetical protein
VKQDIGCRAHIVEKLGAGEGNGYNQIIVFFGYVKLDS